MAYANLCMLKTMAAAILGHGVVSMTTLIRATFQVSQQHKPGGIVQGS